MNLSSSVPMHVEATPAHQPAPAQAPARRSFEPSWQALPLPADPASLNPAFLTAALRWSGRLGWAAVTVAEREPLGREPRRSGTIVRIRLQFDVTEEGAPASVIAKLPAAPRGGQRSPAPRNEREPLDRALREVQFYKQVPPLGGVAAPRLLYAGSDVERGRAAVLLEDAPDGRLGEVARGCTVDDAALVIEGVARLHAGWWRNATAGGFAWLPHWAADARAQQARLAEQIPLFLLKFGHRLPLRVRTAVESLRQNYAALLVELGRAPQTLINGDLQLDAVLFHKARNRAAASIVDWQAATLGPGAVDFALFLAGSLEARLRRETERELLALYYARLLEAGIRGYSFADLLRDYRLGLLWSLARLVERMAAVDPDHLVGRERALVDAVFEKARLFAALLDHDAADLIAA